MSLFKKPKKHIQRRVFGSNEDDEGSERNEHNGMEIDEDEKLDFQSIQKNKKKDRKDRSQTKQTLLSFGDEEEGEVFQVKKSSHSKKIMRLLDKERRKKKEDKVEIEEIKPKLDEKRTEIVTGDLVMVVKNSEPSQILNGRAALCAGRDDMSSEEEEEEESTGHKFSQPDSVKIVLESGKIPDAAMIHAARKRRQRARELGDYIPLDEAQASVVPDKDRGRLIREDQDDSDEERIDMTVNHTARDRDKRREQFFAAQDEESEHDTDKEMEEWENQQIRKGVTGAQLMAASQESNFTSYVTTPVTKVEYTASSVVPPPLEPGAPRTPQAIADKLRQRLSAVRESRERHRADLSRVTTDLGDAAAELQRLEARAPRAAQRFRFYQELRGYVTDLVECLDEKVPVIAALEQRALELLGRRAERLAERRRQDVRDQAEEVALAAKPGMRRGGVEEETRVRRAAEREGRRARRRRAREIPATVSPGLPKHLEGMSSDDEEPDQDIITFQAQKEQILVDVRAVFDDVVEDFSSVTAILEHFARWRDTDLSAYTEAYANLCLPRAVSPLLRLALVFWQPLNDDMDVDKCTWYATLMLYGARPGESEDTLTTDPDIQLVPTVIDKIVVPKLVQLVERCWDPMSSSQTLRLVGLLGRYVRRYPSIAPTSKSLNTLFNTVLDKLKSAVEHDVFIPIFPKQMLESKSPFFQRQFASGLKLLRNVTSWQGIINDHMLKDLALGALLNRYLLSGLRVCQLTDAVSKAGLISHILPRVWLQSDVQQLQMFSNYVSQLASQLDKDNPLHLESVETVASILKSLRCT